MSDVCTPGCKTKDHASFAECMQAKNVTTKNSTASRSANYQSHKLWATEIKEYRDARSQGIQPRSTKLADIRSAVDRSEAAGAPVKEA